MKRGSTDHPSTVTGDLSPETLVTRVLGGIDKTTPALVPPIHPATTYLRDADGSYSSGRGYTRADNPTYDEPEQMLAALEGGAGCMLFASGMTAATAVIHALVPGDHVVASRVMYWALRKWLNQFAVTWGLELEYVDTSDLEKLDAAMRPGKTRLVWIETPANPTWDVTDITAAAEIAHRVHAKLVVDSTVATPVLTKPLGLGADLVVHSASKYLNGHSDVLAGAVVTAAPDPFWQRIRSWRSSAGGVLGPFEAWLLLRGMRTLYLRVKRSSESALAIANHFHGHPRLLQVLYPGLPSHPGHDIAARQMTGGFGGMLSVRLKGGEAAAMSLAAEVSVFKRATSLGGFESLVEHRASIEGPSTPVPSDLLRLSIGLESPGDLIVDLEQALDKTHAADMHTSAQTHTNEEAQEAPPPPNPQIAEYVEAQVRPMVLDRGGDVAFRGMTGGIVYLQSLGSPGALIPMRGAIENALRHHYPEVAGVNFDSAPNGNEHPSIVHAAPGSAPLRERVQRLLDESVNPGIAAHDGAIRLRETTDNSITVEFAGRCQGCAMAEVTLRQGVEVLLKERIPEIEALFDATDHSAGTDPYYQAKKSGGGV